MGSVSAPSDLPRPPGAREPLLGAGGRLLGVDGARGLALLGMMATHVYPEAALDGGVTVSHAIFSGRSSALFAVLAGVGLALATGGAEPRRGEGLRAARRGVWARAAVITGVGLLLGLWPSGVAVILVNYGVLFVVGTAVLGLPARALLPLAVVWLVGSPAVSHLLRSAAPEPSLVVPSLRDLLAPVDLVLELVLTGYYPVLTWTGYLLLGLAVGRSRLRRPGTAAVMAVAGAGAAVGVWLVSGSLSERAVAAGAVPGAALSYYGTTPTGSWWWLVLRAPHSGTPFDLVHTAGCAVAVLGAALLLPRWRPAALASIPLVAVGGMTLTLYTAHVLVLPVMGLFLEPTASYVVQVLGVLTVATAWWYGAQRGVLGRRGPLEQVAAGASRAASRRRPASSGDAPPR